MRSPVLRAGCRRLLVVVLGCALVVASAGLATAGIVQPVATFTSDATSGISSSITYTGLLDFQGTTGTSNLVNGVQFTGTGTGRSGALSLGSSWAMTGVGGNYGPPAANFPAGFTLGSGNRMYNVLNSFIYDGKPGTLTISGLTPGTTYDARIYYRAWGGIADRTNTLKFDEGTGSAQTVVINEDADASAHFLDYRYTVGASGTLTISQSISNGTAASWHWYGFSNQIVAAASTWNPSAGSDWNTAGNWSPSTVPNAVDANALLGPGLSGPGAINLSGTATVGTLQFSGTNDVSLTSSGPALTLQALAGAAIVTVASGTHSISAPLNLASAAVLSLTHSNQSALTVSGAISGANVLSIGGLGAGGTAVVTLAGTNTYTGGTVVNSPLRFASTATVPGTGTIQINPNGALLATGPTGYTNAAQWLASGLIANSSSGALALVADDSSNLNFATGGYNRLGLGAAGNYTYSGTITPGANGYYLGGGGGTLTVASSLVGTSATTINGNVTLAAANTHSGATTVTAGTLVLAHSAALQNSGLALNAGGLGFDSSVASHAFTVGSLAGSVGISLNDNGGSPNPVALTVGGNGGTTAYSAALTGSGSLRKSGSGTMTLSGSSNYSGGTTISAGAIAAGHNNAFGAGTIYVAGGQIYNVTARTIGNALELSGTNVNAIQQGGSSIGTYTGAVALNGNTTVKADGGAGLTFSNGIDTAGNTLVVNGDSGSTINFFGNISGGGSVVSNGSLVTLAGTNNSYATTTVVAGTLAATNTGALPNYLSSGSVSVAAGATLRLHVAGSGWASSDLDTLRSNGAFASGASLGIDTTNGNFSYPSNLGSNLNLVKTGTNTLTLSGPGTLGNLTHSAGGMTLVSSGSIGTINAGSVNIAAGTSLNYVLGSPGNGTQLKGAALTLPASGTAITVNLTDNAGANGQGSMGANGTYPLLGYTSLSGGNATFNNTFTVGTKPAAVSSGRSFNFVNAGTNNGAVALTITSLNPTMVLDTFNRAGNVNGSSPVVQNGTSNTWAGATNWTTSTTNGGQANAPNADSSNYIAFTPVAGNVYTYSVLLHTTTSATNWQAIGFANSTPPAGNPNNANTRAWMLQRYSGPGQTFYGGGTGNALSMSSTLNGPRTNTMVLDTRGGLSTAVLYYHVDGGTAQRTVTGFNASDIRNILFGAMGGTTLGTAQNLILSNGPTWNTIGSGSWSASGNWSAGYQPAGAGATATFPPIVGASGGTVSLDGNQTVGQLTFANGSAGGYTIAQGTTGTLTFDNNGNGAAVSNYGGANTISAPVSLNDNLQAMVSTGSTLNVTGSISDTGTHSLAVNPTGTGGTLILSASNGFPGTTNLYGGALRVGHADALAGGGAITFYGGSLQYSSANTTDYNTRIANSTGPVALDTNGQSVTLGNPLGASNTGGFFRTGAGTLTITGSHAYSGLTVFGNAGSGITVLANLLGASIPGNVQIGNGTAGSIFVQMGAGNQFAANAVVSFNGTGGNNPHLVLLANSQVVGTISDLTGQGVIENSQSEAVNTPATLTLTNPANSTFSGYFRNTAGAATGTIGLNIVGSGGLTLSGANITYTGATTIPSGGTLTLLNATAFNSAITNNGTLNVFTNGSNMYGTYNTGFAKVISGSGGLVKSGTSTFGVKGANTYSGGTSIAAGRIYLYSASGLGTGTVTVGGSSSLSIWVPGTNTITNNIVLNGLGAGNDAIFGDGGGGAGGGGSYTLSGSITLNATSSIGAYSVNPITITGRITGPGGLVKNAIRTGGADDAGTVTLSNINNDYLGGTTVNYGTLKQGASGVIPYGPGKGDLTINANSTFDLGGFNASINGLSGGGNAGNSGGAATLTVGYNDASSTFSGVVSGSTNLQKTGTGNLRLTAANTFTGFATANAGTLSLANSGAAAAATLIHTPNVAFAGGIGTFTLGNLSGANNLALADVAGASINLRIGNNSTSSTYSGVVSGSGSLAKIGANTLTLTNTSTYTGGTTVSGGQLTLGNPDVLPSGQAVTINGGTLSLPAALQTVTTGSLSFQGGLVTGGTVTRDTIYDAQAGTVASALAGSAGLVKTTSGTCTLTSSNNAYSGGNTINAGTLAFSAGALPGAITFAGNSTLQWTAGNAQDVSAQIQPIPGGVTAGFNPQGNSVSFAAALTGTGGIAKVGTGLLTLASTDNSYSGGTTLTGGTLSISSLLNLGSGSLTFNGGVLQITGTDLATLDAATYNAASFNGGFDVPTGNTFTVNQDLAGAGSMTKTGGGTLVVNGTNTFSGGSTINAGVVTYSHSDATGNAPGKVLVAGGAVAAAGYPIDQAFVNRIATASAGAVALGISSTNDVNFSTTGASLATASLGAVGSQTYSGVFIPTGGTAGAYKLGGAGGTLTFVPAIAGSATLTVVGPGTVVLPTANSYTGATAISGGVATLANQACIPDNTALSVSGGTLDLGGFNKAFTQTANFNNAAGGITNSGGTLATLSLTLTGADMTVANVVKDGAGPVAISVTSGGGTAGRNVDFTNPNNNFSGGLSVSNASIRMGIGTNLASAFGTGTVTVSNSGFVMLWTNTGSQTNSVVTVANNWVLNTLGGAQVASGAPAGRKSAIFADGAGAGSAETILTGTIALASDAGIGGYPTNHVTVQGLITGSGALHKDILAGGNGGNTVTLTNTGNNYQGGTFINQGILAINSDGALGAATGGVTFGGSTTLRAIADGIVLNAGRAVAIPAATATIDTQSYAMSILGDISGTGGLTKTGGTASMLTLSGTGSTFSGNVTVSAGGVTITNSAAFGAGPKTVSMTAGASNPYLRLNGAGGDIALPSNINFQTSAGAFSGTIFNDAGNNTIAGNVLLTAGGGNTILVSNSGLLTLSGAVSTNTTNRLLVLDGSSSGALSGTVINGGANPLGLVKQGGGTWTLSGSGNYTGGTTVNAGTLVVSGTLNPTAGTATVSGGATLDVVGLMSGPTLTSSGATTFNAGATGSFTTLNVAGGATTVAGGATTSISTANVSAGLLSLGNTAAVPQLNMTGGTIAVGGGLTTVTNADLTGGTAAGTVVSAVPNSLLVTNQVKLPGNVTLMYASGGSATGFLARGNNLLDNASVRTLTLSGGTLSADTFVSGLNYASVTDATSGISSANSYTHAIDFGDQGAPAAINGVTFAKNIFTAGGGSGSIDSPNQTNGNSQNYQNVTGGLAQIYSDFKYGANPANVVLTGLTPGAWYDLRMFQRTWASTSDDRTQTFNFYVGNATSPQATVRYNEDNPANANLATAWWAAAASSWTAGTAYAMDYVYQADAAGRVRFTATYSGTNATLATYHVYGLANQLLTGHGTIGLTAPTTDFEVAANSAINLPAGNNVLGNLSISGSGTQLAVNSLSGATFANITANGVGNAPGASVATSFPSIGLSGGTVNVVAADDLLTLGGLAASGGGGLHKTGAGELLLNGSSGYTGGTTVAAGMLKLGHAAALGTGGLTANGGTVDLAGFSPTVSALAGASGVVTNSATGAAALVVNQATATTFFGQLLDGPAAVQALTKNGTGNLTLAASNGFSGNATLNDGVVTLANSAALANAMVYVDGEDNALGYDAGLVSATIGGLRGSAALLLEDAVSAGVELRVGNNSADSTYSGTLSGVGSLTKIGTGTLNLSGTNAFTGGTSVEAGLLVLSDAAALADGTALSVGADTATLFAAPWVPSGPPQAAQPLHAVPEPGTLGLLAFAGLAALVIRRWRRAKGR